MTIAAKFHEESRDEVRSGGLDEKSEEVFVSDTVWYRVGHPWSDSERQRQLPRESSVTRPLDRGWSHL